MVDERITDGERIAQLLASELSGLETGPLADLTVVDADPEASPTESGTVAYAVAFDGERVGEVRMYPERVRVALATPAGRFPDVDLDVETAGEDAAGDVVVIVDSGATVKRAVDAVREVVVLSDPENGSDRGGAR